MKLIHIVASGAQGEIGNNNNLLWHIPEDLKWFKEATNGHVIIVGRKTLESMPVIRGRYIVMLTRDQDALKSYKYPKNVFRSIDILQAVAVAKTASELYFNQNKAFVIGGAEIYKQTEHLIDEVWQTQVNILCKEHDAVYTVPKGFEPYFYADWKQCPVSGLQYRLVKWRRLPNV